MLNFTDRDLSLEDLETVLTVSECGQFTRAGEMLHRSQPAITRSVHAVERSLETALLDRTTRPTSPTPAGEDFRYEVRKGLYFIMRGFRKARCIGRRENSSLEIGHSTYLDPSIVAFLSNIAKMPNVGFSAVYHSSSSAEIVAKVRAGVWDCGIVVRPATTLDLEFMPILKEPLCVVMPSDHPLASKKAVQLKDLDNQRLILPARDRNVAFRSWFIERCQRSGVTPSIIQEVTHPHEGVLLAAEKIGLAITNQSTARTIRKSSTVLRRLSDDMVIEFSFVLRREARSQALAAYTRAVTMLRDRIASLERRKDSVPIPAQVASEGEQRTSAHRLRRA